MGSIGEHREEAAAEVDDRVLGLQEWPRSHGGHGGGNRR